MPSCIRAANPIWFFNDLIGFPLNDQYYISFLTNTFPYLPQPVHQDVNCATPWANPLQFGPNGALPSNMYWNPNLVWRLEIRRGPLQSDALIYEVNNFSPGNGGNITPSDTSLLTQDNQITNPQFAQISFTNNLIFTVAGTYDIAPGWKLILTGPGPATCTLTQIIESGTSVTVDPGVHDNSIPYALRINSNGWVTVTLQQTLNHNGAIWAGGAVGGLLVGRSDIVNEQVSMHYVPSTNPPLNNTILTANLTTGNFSIFSDILNLPISANNDTSDVAFVNINLVLPPTGIVYLTDINVTGQNVPFTSTEKPQLHEETIERAIDHEFHLYSTQLITRPKKNILTGWNFALNPYQFYTPIATTATNLTQYVADQTILHQETLSAVQTSRGANVSNFGLNISARNAVVANRFAIIQYIDPRTILPFWGTKLSAFVRARIFTNHNTVVRLKARLIWRATLPPVIGAAEPITGWDANGDVTFSAGWNALLPLNDPAYIILPTADTTIGPSAFHGYSYDQFSLPASPVNTTTAATVGIVLYTMDNINNTLGTEDIFAFDSVSLLPILFGSEAEPQTFDEVLRECQYYYEKSYNFDAQPGAVTQGGSLIIEQHSEQSGGNQLLISRLLHIPFKVPKRSTTYTTRLYSPISGAIDGVFGYLYSNGVPVTTGDIATAGNWSVQIPAGQTSITYNPTNVNALLTNIGVSVIGEALVSFHYTIDARLGI